jgi:hypothetical protein
MSIFVKSTECDVNMYAKFGYFTLCVVLELNISRFDL